MTNSKTRLNRYRKLRNRWACDFMRSMERAAAIDAAFFDEMQRLVFGEINKLVSGEWPKQKVEPIEGNTYAEAVLLAEHSATLFGVPVRVNKHIPPDMIVVTDRDGNVKGCIKGIKEAK